MKKSALLAVSALSLGVVGLATFTPIVNAATDSMEANVTVKILGSAGIGDEGGSSAAGALDVDFGSISAGESKIVDKAIRTANNTSNNGTLTVANKDADTAMNGQSAGGSIAASTGTTGALAALTGNQWGINVKNDATSVAEAKFQVVTQNPVTIGTDADREDGEKTFAVKYGVSTEDTLAEDTYTDKITYTFTVAE